LYESFDARSFDYTHIGLLIAVRDSSCCVTIHYAAVNRIDDLCLAIDNPSKCYFFLLDIFVMFFVV
jgi:hypothetical protein